MPKLITPTWKALKRQRTGLLERFGNDTFLAQVLRDCHIVGKDDRLVVRGNFATAGLREAVGHVMHSLAPDEDVRRCVWFKQATGTRTVTRRQCAKFIVVAGLPDRFVEEQLQLELEDFTAPLLESIETLNKLTHVRHNTILSGERKIRRMFGAVLSSLTQLLDAAEESRKAVCRAIEEQMHEAVFQSFMDEAIDELVELSTHTRVDGHGIESITVDHLDWKEIHYRVEGWVDVELQYGSNSDQRNGLGTISDDSFPYSARVTCRASAPLEIDPEMVVLNVDNDSFYR